MLKREHIERLLALNGVTPAASDEEIKSLLLGARWTEDDVEAAVIVLRENKSTHERHVDSLHKVFQSDDRLRPDVVASLLGVHMDVSAADIKLAKKRKRGSVSLQQGVSIALFAIILAASFVLVSMWHLEVGVFHQTLR